MEVVEDVKCVCSKAFISFFDLVEATSGRACSPLDFAGRLNDNAYVVAPAKNPASVRDVRRLRRADGDLSRGPASDF